MGMQAGGLASIGSHRCRGPCTFSWHATPSTSAVLFEPLHLSVQQVVAWFGGPLQQCTD